LQFLLEVYLITFKARIIERLKLSVQGFLSSSPTIAYLFDCLLVKLCQFSIAYIFYETGFVMILLKDKQKYKQ
jgi:hypothetical protein